MAVLRNIWRWVAGGFAAAVLLLGLATGLFRLLVPALPEYQRHIEAWASEALKVPVTLGSYDLRWSLEGPQLVFYDGELWTPDRSERVLHADGGAVRLSLVDLVRGRIRPSSLMLRGAQITLERSADGTWRIFGRDWPAVRGSGEPSVLPRGQLELRDATVLIADGNGPPLRLTGVRLELERGSDYLRLAGALDLPHQRDGHLEVVIQTDPGPSERWQAYVRGQRLDLSLLTRFVPGLRDELRGGDADLTLWASLTGRRPDEGSLTLDARNLDFVDAGDSATEYERLRGRVGWQRLPGGWRLQGEDVRITRGGSSWAPTRFSLEIDDDGGVGAAEASYLRLDDLTPLLVWLPAGDLKRELLATGATGEVQDFAFRRVGAGSEATLRAHFTNVGIAAAPGRPGIAGLTGSVRMEEDRGRVELASPHLVLSWPDIFRQPMPVAELRGALGWRRQGQDWRIMSEEILLATDDLRSRAQLELVLPADHSSPVIDLQLAVEDGNIAAASRYLPAQRMPPRVVEWLDAALHSGRVLSASVSMRGPVRAFPFDGGEGEFVARVQFERARLDYWKEWPAAEEIEGAVEFRNASLSGQVRAASIGGNRIGPAIVNIADLREGVLEFTGHSSGDIDALIAYLRTTGLTGHASVLERGLAASGPSELELDFSLPVRRLDGTRVRGSLQMNGVTVAMSGLRQRLEQVSGVLEYGDGGLHASDVEALFLGRPARVALEPQRAEDGRTLATMLELEGRFDAIDLGAGLNAQLGRALSGSSVYRASARLPQDGAPLEIEVHSDLAGTEIRLPAPLAKGAEPIELAVHARFETPDVALVDVALGQTGQALIQAVRDPAGWRFARGSVSLQGDAPLLAEAEGLGVQGRVDTLDVGAWLDYDGGQEGATTPSLTFLDLEVGDLIAFDQRFADVRVEVDRNDREWLVQLEGEALRGSLFVPLRRVSGEPLVAKLDVLHIASGGDEGAADPRSLRPLRAEIRDFSYNEMKFGFVALDIDPTPGGVTIKRVATVAPAFTIEGKGEWLLNDLGHHSALDFTVKSKDVKATLTALDFDTSLSAADAEITGTVSWPGPPGPHFREQLSGNVKLRVGEGTLENVQPGAGRMFGLLSVAALPRRLSLDFSDVFEKGLGFDEIHGDFRLESGNAYTENLALEGPAADVGIIGRTGLVARDYDQTAIVYANFGASLPVAGAIAAGPAVGAALLIFSQVFKKPLKAMSSQHYRITGSWEDPLVERIDAPAPPQTPAEKAPDDDVATADSFREHP